MRVLIQRVARAAVRIEGEAVGEIERGLLLLVGMGAEDEADGGAALAPMAAKVAGLRIFADAQGRMNRSLQQLTESGEPASVLAISQFTLHADCRRGRRPSFTAAARPEAARELFDRFVAQLEKAGLQVQTGRFGAMMDVDLVNDGPVTIWLDSAEVIA